MEKGWERRHLACIRRRRPADGPAGETPTDTAGWKPALPFVLLALLLTACTQPAANNEPENKEVKEHRDQWRPREAQSDFLDIGKQAGIKWLSFVPQDQLDYPEYFEGLDRDQKRRLRLAPKGSDEQVLVEFDLPDGFKLWPVDWYGTELMAFDFPKSTANVSVALATPVGDLQQIVKQLAQRRKASLDGQWAIHESVNYAEVVWASRVEYAYAAREFVGKSYKFVAIAEWERTDSEGGTNVETELVPLLNRTSVQREISLEGSPKHKCLSTLQEQLAGMLRFPNGTLNLPVAEEMLVRKIGGDSTIQIDGQGAEPWILIRRLDANAAEGDMRATLRKDTTFNRRLKVTSGKWSAGYVPEGAKLPIVCFDYDDTAAENNLMGILKAGDELLTFEVVTRGITDGMIRRAAKQAAIKLLAGATGDPSTEAPEFEPLIGWNMGTMGND